MPPGGDRRIAEADRDASYQALVAALWVLVGTSAGADADRVRAAAATASAALGRACREESHVLLHERDGALFVNGRRLRLCVEVFTAIHGITELLRSHDASELLFDASVDAAGLIAWARCWATVAPAGQDPEAALRRAGAHGVHASSRAAGPEQQAGGRAMPVGDGGSSRLRSVFLQHRLLALLDPRSPVEPAQANQVVQVIVERLLAEPGGMEPLMLLQRDERLLSRSLTAAVLAVVLARAAGWHDCAAADLGAAALFAEVGEVLDRRQPAASASAWLLERGEGQFWQLGAAVARRWRTDRTASMAEIEGIEAGIALFVRLAAAVGASVAQGDRDVERIRGELAAAARRGCFPHELVDVVARVLEPAWA